jgi:hypothetical protein
MKRILITPIIIFVLTGFSFASEIRVALDTVCLASVINHKLDDGYRTELGKIPDVIVTDVKPDFRISILSTGLINSVISWASVVTWDNNEKLMNAWIQSAGSPYLQANIADKVTEINRNVFADYRAYQIKKAEKAAADAIQPLHPLTPPSPTPVPPPP